MGVWAKSDETTLSAHTLDVLRWAKELWKGVEKKIRFGTENGLTKEEFRKMLLVAAFAHDFGKVWPRFQWDLANEGYMKGLEKDNLPRVQHNLLSVFFLNKQRALNFITEDKDKWKTIAPLLYSAIAFHHWRTDSKSILYGIKTSLHATAKNLLKTWENRTLGEALEEKLLKELKEKEDEFKGEFYKNWAGLVEFHKDFTEYIANGGTFIQTKIFYPPYTLEFLPVRLKSIVEDEKESFTWVFLAGFLMRADHFASWLKKYDKEKKEKILIEKRFPEVKFLESLPSKWWQRKIFEKEQDLNEKNILLIAPTGIGKTEFAFAWGEGEKFIFTLPLRVATNQIFERAQKIFEKETKEKDKEAPETGKKGGIKEENRIVGLLHSDADIFLAERSEDQEGEAFLTLELSRHLSLPVIIATGDQFFPSALRYPGYEKIYATLGYSRLIIDEVQAYDPKAAAIVVKLIKDITALGGKFLLMTATLPEFVKEALKGLDYEEIDLFGKGKFKFPKKHKVEIRKEDIKEVRVAKEIVKKASEGKRVLVVLNTVEKAQDVYEKIKQEIGDDKSPITPILLHSRFTFDDRKRKEVGEKEGVTDKLKKRKKEEELWNSKTGAIVVATQIVEASLDIDADYLYTEISPADSLVQRMGRVLRGIRPQEKGKVWGEDDYNKYYKEGKEANGKIEANVKIFVDEKKEKDRKRYESGKGKVYENYLIEATIYTLHKLKDNKEGEDFLADLERKKLKSEVERILKLKKKGRKKEETNASVFSMVLEERIKKKWVEEVYNTDFLRRVDYLQEFYNTLDVLEAGYVSEQKDEAHRLFREIRSVNVIPEGKVEEAIGELKKFAEDKETYTDFKRDFINKFVVPVNEPTLKWNYKKDLNPFTSYLSDDIPRKLSRYLQGIYVVDLEYSEEEGLLPPGGKTDKEQQENE